MNLLTKPAMIVNVVALLLASLGALHILLDLLGDAAWNGVNVPIGIYLALAVLSFFGFLVCAGFGFSRKRFVPFLAAACSGVILGLASVFAVSFIFYRDPHTPLNAQVTSMFGVTALHAPLLALYAYCMITAAVAGTLSLLKLRQLRSTAQTRSAVL
jgi:small-conductance mechanosensitive channel